MEAYCMKHKKLYDKNRFWVPTNCGVALPELLFRQLVGGVILAYYSKVSIHNELLFFDNSIKTDTLLAHWW